ncbi:hypothetical protein ACFZBZ_01795 [Streptomyces sp. NPDC008196]|uniref:hypothetical protein n=1 Tax=Streptomyces sp. NPDC008196 TaxID=3364819 RepID=UPI0036EF5200
MRAARDLFLAQGYDKTSLAQNTREARVSTGTLFMCSTSSCLRPAIPERPDSHRPRLHLPGLAARHGGAVPPHQHRASPDAGTR